MNLTNFQVTCNQSRKGPGILKLDSLDPHLLKLDSLKLDPVNPVPTTTGFSEYSHCYPS
jgi:hypothetical protein